jgi:transcriptional regulator with XRE-family HTH domain
MFFHQNLKTIRKSWGLSQGDIAAKFNVSQGTVSAWEQSTVPPLESIIGLADMFKISLDKFIREKLTPQTAPPRWGGKEYPPQPEETGGVLEDLSDGDVQELKALIAALRKLVEDRLGKLEAEQLVQRKQIERLGEGK